MKRAVALLMLLGAGPAFAYDAATTHAGLTEKAALASTLHRVLSRRLGRPLGVLEPLQLHSRLLDAEARRSLWARLQALDPAGGYRPGNDGVTTALSWVIAGAVLAETPPERGRNHFFEPRRHVGLDDGPGLAGAAHAVRLAIDSGATVRQIATGTAFDITGQPSVAWVSSPQNDQGIPMFLDRWEHSIAGADPAERESALVQGLLALGGIAAVLEDAGEPAHVRNDFRVAFLQRQGPSSWDRASGFERFVAGRYGRIGVPAPLPAVRRPTLDAFFAAKDGQGLADRTQRRFFSPGSLPEDVGIDAQTTPKEVTRSARDSLPFPRPGITGLELKDASRPKYMMIEGRRSLGYVREPRRIRFFLDPAVYADASKALLPEVGAYAVGLIDHLLRAGVKLERSGGSVTASLEGVTGTVDGRLRFFAEDALGVRRELTAAAGQPLSVSVPVGAKRIAAVLRGQDAAGPLVAAGELAE